MLYFITDVVGFLQTSFSVAYKLTQILIISYPIISF